MFTIASRERIESRSSSRVVDACQLSQFHIGTSRSVCASYVSYCSRIVSDVVAAQIRRWSEGHQLRLEYIEVRLGVLVSLEQQPALEAWIIESSIDGKLKFEIH